MSTCPALLEILAALPCGDDVVVVRDGTRAVVAVAPTEVLTGDGPHGLAALRRIEQTGGWWAGFLGYDLGHSIERIVTRRGRDLPVPDVAFARFDARLVLEPGEPPRIEGRGPSRSLLERAASTMTTRRWEPPRLRDWRSSLDRDEWGDRVAEIQRLLVAGDCYQVNLTRRLTSEEPVDPRGLFAALHTANPAPHEALLDFRAHVGTAVVSASPERFLARRDDVIETRPIKGTHRDAAWLSASPKDRAENVMIVDLARNDLGRVCRFGTIHVPGLCELEAHPGLHHLVSTVRGRLRADVSLADLVAASFPAASVTGAPKPRVLQAIEDLEPVRRGVYCGALGWIDASARALDLSVAIRTFTVTSEAIHLGVGGGIVADSVADEEWDETELKAHRLLAAAGAQELIGAGP